MDVGTDLLKDKVVIGKIQSEAVNMARFVGMTDMSLSEEEDVVELDKSENKLLTAEDVEEMQQKCFVVSVLRCIREGVPGRRWPLLLSKRMQFAERFVLCE